MPPQHPWIADALPIEQELLRNLDDLSNNTSRMLAVSGADSANSRISGHFIRWLLLEHIPSNALSISSLKFDAVVVVGTLDITTKEIPVAVIFQNCTFSDDIDLTDASAPKIEFESCTINRLLADRVTTAGAPRIRRIRNLISKPSKVRFLRNGAHIGGNLDLRGSAFGTPQTAPESTCIWADGLTVDGNMLLTDGFTSRGEIRLNGANLKRTLDCSGATVLNHRGFSISAAGASIAGTAYFCKPKSWSDSLVREAFRSEGRLRLSGAKIGGHLDLDEGQFVASVFAENLHPAEPTAFDPPLVHSITGNGIEVGAELNLHSSHIRGGAVFINAKIKGDLNIEDTNFDFPGQETLTFRQRDHPRRSIFPTLQNEWRHSASSGELRSGLTNTKLFSRQNDCAANPRYRICRFGTFRWARVRHTCSKAGRRRNYLLAKWNHFRER